MPSSLLGKRLFLQHFLHPFSVMLECSVFNYKYVVWKCKCFLAPTLDPKSIQYLNKSIQQHKCILLYQKIIMNYHFCIVFGFERYFCYDEIKIARQRAAAIAIDNFIHHIAFTLRSSHIIHYITFITFHSLHCIHYFVFIAFNLSHCIYCNVFNSLHVTKH